MQHTTAWRCQSHAKQSRMYRESQACPAEPAARAYRIHMRGKKREEAHPRGGIRCTRQQWAAAERTKSCAPQARPDLPNTCARNENTSMGSQTGNARLCVLQGAQRTPNVAHAVPGGSRKGAQARAEANRTLRHEIDTGNIHHWHTQNILWLKGRLPWHRVMHNA